MDLEELEKHIICPECSAPLTFSADTGIENLNGYYRCRAAHTFPVIKKIPRLLPANLLSAYLKFYYPEIHELQFYRERAKVEAQKVEKTMFSFGFQWSTFSDDHQAWQTEYERCLAPIDERQNFGEGKLVADIGCGMGRMIFRASMNSAQFIGFDLSHAIEAAASLCENRKNVLFIQGDLLHPPFRQNTFDTLYSVGVLHHLPKGVKSGLDSLLPSIKEKGFMLAWLYGAQRGDDNNSFSQHLRKILGRFSLRTIYYFSYVYAFIVLTAINFPAKIFAKFKATASLEKHFPFHSWRNMNLNAIACNVFDYYATPVEHGYNQQQMEELIENYPLMDLKLNSLSTPFRKNESWHLYGLKR